MPRVLSLLVALCALAAACGGGGSAAGSSEGAVVIERPTRASVPWAEIPGFEESTGPCPPDVDNDTIADAGTPIVSLERIVDLPDAATIAFMRSGTAFVGSRDGRVYRWDRSLVGPVLDLSDDTLVDNDAGLLGLAVGPAGDRLYMYRTDGDGDSVLSAYRLDSGRLDAGSATVLLDADQPTSQHNAGSIVFDRDGHLFVALGDGGGLGDPFRTSQDIESAFGAMLRLEPRPGEVPAAVAPAGNPFAGPVPGNDLIWATGLRNPYRFSIDPLNGDLWIATIPTSM